MNKNGIQFRLYVPFFPGQLVLCLAGRCSRKTTSVPHGRAGPTLTMGVEELGLMASHRKAGSAPHLRESVSAAWTDQIRTTTKALSWPYPIHDRPECVKELDLQNRSHGISMIWNNSRISEKSFREHPVMMVCQKPMALPNQWLMAMNTCK